MDIAAADNILDYVIFEKDPLWFSGILHLVRKVRTIVLYIRLVNKFCPRCFSITKSVAGWISILSSIGLYTVCTCILSTTAIKFLPLLSWIFYTWFCAADAECYTCDCQLNAHRSTCKAHSLSYPQTLLESMHFLLCGSAYGAFYQRLSCPYRHCRFHICIRGQHLLISSSFAY